MHRHPHRAVRRGRAAHGAAPSAHPHLTSGCVAAATSAPVSTQRQPRDLVRREGGIAPMILSFGVLAAVAASGQMLKQAKIEPR